MRLAQHVEQIDMQARRVQVLDRLTVGQAPRLRDRRGSDPSAARRGRGNSARSPGGFREARGAAPRPRSPAAARPQAWAPGRPARGPGPDLQPRQEPPLPDRGSSPATILLAHSPIGSEHAPICDFDVAHGHRFLFHYASKHAFASATACFRTGRDEDGALKNVRTDSPRRHRDGPRPADRPGRTAALAGRLPLGSRADLTRFAGLPARRGPRGGRGARRRRPRRARRRARRPALPDRLHRPPRRGGRRIPSAPRSTRSKPK